jgi:hypothetical protein
VIRPAFLILVPALAFPILSYRIISGDSAANAALASADAVVAPVPDAPSFGMRDEATYSVILERPIFSPSRHPVASKAPTGTANPSGISLLGVVSRAGRAIALIRPGPGAPAMKAEAGQEVAGWQLTSVAPAKVLLERQGGRLELKLPFKAASRVRVPIVNAVRQPQAAQQPAAGQQAPAAQQPVQPQPAAAAVPPPPQEQPSAQEIEADQEPS